MHFQCKFSNTSLESVVDDFFKYNTNFFIWIYATTNTYFKSKRFPDLTVTKDI